MTADRKALERRLKQLAALLGRTDALYAEREQLWREGRSTFKMSSRELAELSDVQAVTVRKITNRVR